MTKADIVSEIAKSTGIEKVQVQMVVEAFMESVKGSLIQGQRRIPPRFRQLHREEARPEGGPQYPQGYHHHHSRAQHPRIQARQELRCEGEITNN